MFEKKVKLGMQKIFKYLVILKRLEQQGYLSKLYDIFKDIKQDEDTYTLGELKKIANNSIVKDPSFDLDE